MYLKLFYFILYLLLFSMFFPPFSLFIEFVFLFPSIQFSCSVMSDSLRPYRLQHAQASLSIMNSQSLLKLMSIELMMQSNHLILCRPRLLLPSVFPSIRVFPVRQFFASSGQSIGVSALTSVLPMNIQDWLLVGSHCSSRDSPESSPTPQFKSINFLVLSFLYSPTLTSAHDYWKNHSFVNMDLCQQRSLPFNILSRFVTAFLPRRKCLLISWLQLLSSVVLEPKKIKFVSASTFSPSICYEVMGWDTMILDFWMLSY